MTGAIALRQNGETLASASLEQVGRRHAQTLVAEVESLLRRVGRTVRQLDVVAVSIGPGSFTGLRVGVVFAKTLAYAIGCRLVEVDTLRAVAAAVPRDVSNVLVVSDAQRGELFVGDFVCDAFPISPIRQGDIMIQTAEEFRHRVEQRARVSTVVISGPAAAALCCDDVRHVRTLAAEFQRPQAEWVAQLGEQQAQAGDTTDPWRLEPFYLRRSAAEEKAAAPIR
jgi:tRNA threonylcarbamoyladenosine biosynthesis protein TsaB